MWLSMKSDQYFAASSGGIGSDMWMSRSRKPYAAKVPSMPTSATKTGSWPSSRQACAMPTELSAGPNAASGKKMIVLRSVMGALPSGVHPGCIARSARERQGRRRCFTVP